MQTDSRFSRTQIVYWGVIAMMTLVAAISVWRVVVVGQVNQQLKLENRDYQTRLGFFQVDDRSKYHALKLADRGDRIERFRVWLPTAGKFQLYWAGNDIPQKGLPVNGTELGEPLASGMYDIEVKSWKSRDKKPGYPQPRVDVEVTVVPVDEEETAASPGYKMYRRGVGHREVDPDVKYLWRGNLGLTGSLVVKPISQPLMIHGVRWMRVIAPDDSEEASAAIFTPAPETTHGFAVWIDVVR